MKANLLWSLPFSVRSNSIPISPGDPFLHLGSCFAEVLGKEMAALRWPSLTSPLGIAYNPISILQQLQYITGAQRLNEKDLFLAEEQWKHYDFHSSLARPNMEESMQCIQSGILKARTFLESCSYAVITLGTAIVHEFKETGQTVNNRHKQAAHLFQARFLSISEIVEALGKIQSILLEQFQLKQIIWTVSPVRHVRSGLIENNRSKARLLVALENVTEGIPHQEYFPSYELLIDVLRDHRFYASDLVHPSKEAEKWIIDQFVASNFSSEAQGAWSDLVRLHKLAAHQPMNHAPSVVRNHHQKVSDLTKELRTKYPWITVSES
jgi:hypothetical protein